MIILLEDVIPVCTGKLSSGKNKKQKTGASVRGDMRQGAERCYQSSKKHISHVCGCHEEQRNM